MHQLSRIFEYEDASFPPAPVAVAVHDVEKMLAKLGRYPHHDEVVETVDLIANQLQLTSSEAVRLFPGSRAAIKELAESVSEFVVLPYTYPYLYDMSISVRVLVYQAKSLEDAIERLRIGTGRCLIVESPRYFTGLVFSPADARAISQDIAPGNLIAIDHSGSLIFHPDGKYGFDDRVVHIGSLSKSFSLYGSRIGFVVSSPHLLSDTFGLASEHELSPHAELSAFSLVLVQRCLQVTGDFRREALVKRKHREANCRTLWSIIRDGGYADAPLSRLGHHRLTFKTNEGFSAVRDLLANSTDIDPRLIQHWTCGPNRPEEVVTVKPYWQLFASQTPI